MTQTPDLNTYDPAEAAAAEEAREAHNARTEAAMREAGVPVEEKLPVVTYWGTISREKFYLPDGIQYIEFEPMTEGSRQKFQNMTRTTMSLNRVSGDSRVTFDPSKQRTALLEVSVKDWYMLGPDGKPAAFESRQYGWNEWLKQADPKIIEDLEKAILKANPWMQADMDKEEIEREIERLRDLLEEKNQKELGE